MPYPVPEQVATRLLRALDELALAMVDFRMTDVTVQVGVRGNLASLLVLYPDGSQQGWDLPIDDLRSYEEWGIVTTEAATCAHHWILEPGNAARGVCKYCGAERMHTGGGDFGFAAFTLVHPSRKNSITHGLSGYRRHKCRCEVCREANAEHQRRYKERRREREAV